LARTNQLMIPQVWRSPGPDVCKTIQHLCLIKLISANKWVLSLAKMPVSEPCGLQEAKKGFHSAHKDIDKCCKIVLIVRKFKHLLGFEPRSWTNLVFTEVRPKIDPHPLGPGTGDISIWAVVQPFGLVQVVQKIKKAKGAVQILERGTI
jgi:hypothetical protein